MCWCCRRRRCAVSGTPAALKSRCRISTAPVSPRWIAATRKLIDAIAKEPGFTSLLTGFRPNTPQYFVDIDRAAAKNLGVSLADLNETLQISLGLGLCE